MWCLDVSRSRGGVLEMEVELFFYQFLDQGGRRGYALLITVLGFGYGLGVDLWAMGRFVWVGL